MTRVLLVVALLAALAGAQQLLYPLGSDLTYEHVRAFGSEVLERPVGAAMLNEKLYVTDTGHNRIVVFDTRGNALESFGSRGSEPGEFRRPMRLASGPENRLYVADMMNHRIQIFSADGTFVRAVGSEGTGKGEFSQPGGVDVDQDGNMYVVEFAGHRVQKLSPLGNPIRQWGHSGTKGYFHYGYFNYPTDVAASETGRWFVSDTFNDRVKAYDPGGGRHNVWGGLWGFNTSGAFRGWFRGAYGLGIEDESAIVYVTDFGNHRVQVFSLDGGYLGMFGKEGSQAGELQQPTDVAIGPTGDAYVVDYANSRIQVWKPAR